ncbi:DUF3306 domain-containing protein [Pseudophaeobacter sp.]|uniref:DUF3306 domain-containing protein n=1 Tax=Pseudophaeobacter sp. TaxID=1971739 RepID=UPI00329998AE
MSARDFWSRRRAAVEAEAVSETRVLQEQEAVARETAVAERSDDEILAELDLPEPESLGEGDDFKVFLTEQVPTRIKTRALRHLWRANPVLACVDGLVDYGEDFTDAACVIEGMQTAYQVGKGMTAHVEELARQEKAEQEQADAEQQVQPATQPLADENGAEVVAFPPENDTEISLQNEMPEPDAKTLELAERGDSSVQSHSSLPAPYDGVDPAPQSEGTFPAASRRMRFSFVEAQGEL